MISGYTVILFRTTGDLEKSWIKVGHVSEFGGLRVLYDVMEDYPYPTKGELAPISSNPDSIVTSEALRVFHWFSRVKSVLGKFLSLTGNPYKLAASDDLASLSNHPGTPRIIGWGPLREALDGHPLFTTSLNMRTEKSKTHAGTDTSAIAQEAIIEGSQYLWDRKLLTQSVSVSILWRTEQDHDSTTSHPGSLLCMSRLQDQACRVVCFQNFEFALYSRESLRYNRRPLPDKRYPTPRIKGGFILPDSVREAEILCDDSGVSVVPGTFPT